MRKKKKYPFMMNPVEAPIGERKLVYSLYIFHSIQISAAIALFVAFAAVKWLKLDPTLVVNVLEAVFVFYGGGSSLALGIYTYGNVSAKRYYRHFDGDGGYRRGHDQYGGYQGDSNVNIQIAKNAPPDKLPPLPTKPKEEDE